MHSAWECFMVALRLGLTSFGGPVAHVSYFREEYVSRKGWVSEERFGELMSLTQFIPGPGSSQLGAAIGYERAGLLGGFAAWVGFTLPSAIVMVLVALGIGDLSGGGAEGLLRGLKLVALAVVTGALLGMRQSLAPDLKRMAIAVVAFLALYFTTPAWMTIVVIAVAGLVGVYFLPGDQKDGAEAMESKGILGWLALVVFFVILFLTLASENALGGIYRAGALVFGGGHVVLPMLRDTMVGGGLMSEEIFLGGYGATQGVPGPVFTFAAFLGARAEFFGDPWLGAGAAIIAVFLPGMLLLGGTMKIWGRLRNRAWAQRAVHGANAAVVGVLGVALAQMVIGVAKGSSSWWWDAVVFVGLFLVLKKKLIPVWALVLLAAGGGWVMG